MTHPFIGKGSTGRFKGKGLQAEIAKACPVRFAAAMGADILWNKRNMGLAFLTEKASPLLQGKNFPADGTTGRKNQFHQFFFHTISPPWMKS